MVSSEILMPRPYHVPVSEHIDDFEGDWQRALMGLIHKVCPVAELVGDRLFADRGRPNINVFLPHELDEPRAQEELARLGAGIDAFIKRARRRAALDAMEAIDAAPTRPDGLRPDEKGAVLVQHLRAGAAIEGLDFALAHVPPGTDLAGANLKGGQLRQAVLERVNLEGADMRGAVLLHARLAGANLRGALLHEADLRHAGLKGANLADAELHRVRADHVRLDRADLSGADLQDSDLRHAFLRAARLDGAVLRGMLLDADACRRTEWSDGEIIELRVKRGVRLDSLDEFPHAVRAAFAASTRGLTLTFDTRLHRFDATAFDALIAEVLGPDTDVTIEERSNLDAEGPAFIRINGARPEDLIAVAEAFYDRAWARAENAEDAALRRTMTAMEVLFGPRLDEMRDHLVRVEASTNLLAEEDVREAIADKAAEHIAAKRERTFSTRLQRIVRGIGKEAPKKLVAGFIGEKAAEVLGEVFVGVAESVVEETMDVLQ